MPSKIVISAPRQRMVQLSTYPARFGLPREMFTAESTGIVAANMISAAFKRLYARLHALDLVLYHAIWSSSRAHIGSSRSGGILTVTYLCLKESIVARFIPRDAKTLSRCWLAGIWPGYTAFVCTASGLRKSNDNLANRSRQLRCCPDANRQLYQPPIEPGQLGLLRADCKEGGTMSFEQFSLERIVF